MKYLLSENVKCRSSEEEKEHNVFSAMHGAIKLGTSNKAKMP